MNTPAYLAAMDMRNTVEIAEPLAPVTVEPVEPALREELLAAVDERGQVTVRCRIDHGGHVRIWRSTYLVCRTTGHRSELLHADGITLAPMWMAVPPAGLCFTLVFSPLPPACGVFDLIEVVDGAGGFAVHGIARNAQDLYHVVI
jgi:hypothetical protein